MRPFRAAARPAAPRSAPQRRAEEPDVILKSPTTQGGGTVAHFFLKKPPRGGGDASACAGLAGARAVAGGRAAGGRLAPGGGRAGRRRRGGAGQGERDMPCCGGSDADDWYADEELQGKKEADQLPPGRAARRQSFGAVRDMLGGIPGVGSSAHLKEAYRKFCQADRDGSGEIDSQEFRAAFNLPDTPYLQRLWSFFDMDGSGGIGFREFVYGLSRFTRNGEGSASTFAFHLFDADGSGAISRGEFLRAFGSSVQTVHARNHSTWGPDRVESADVLKMGSKVHKDMLMYINSLTSDLALQEFDMVFHKFPKSFAHAAELWGLISVYSREAEQVMRQLKQSGRLGAFLGSIGVEKSDFYEREKQAKRAKREDRLRHRQAEQRYGERWRGGAPERDEARTGDDLATRHFGDEEQERSEYIGTRRKSTLRSTLSRKSSAFGQRLTSVLSVRRRAPSHVRPAREAFGGEEPPRKAKKREDLKVLARGPSRNSILDGIFNKMLQSLKAQDTQSAPKADDQGGQRAQRTAAAGAPKAANRKSLISQASLRVRNSITGIREAVQSRGRKQRRA